MEFAVIFLVFAVCLWFAWSRQARKAIVAYWIGLILTVALYLHHATERLPLSF